MNAFKGIFFGTIIGIIMWLLIAWALWLIIGPRTQAFSHPPMTVKEKKMVKKALKRHGEFPITREGYECRFYMEIKGRKVVL